MKMEERGLKLLFFYLLCEDTSLFTGPDSGKREIMCGIAGTYHIDNRQQILEKMHLRMARRGPDAFGIYCDEKFPVGLTHRRLSILDLSEAGTQPFHSHCGNYVMVFNGEVYNFKDLREALKREKNCEFRTGTDTEVVLEAFIHWGKEFIHMLNGMFAIAIFDRQTGFLHIWRDRLGIKPVFYGLQEQKFCFGSEIDVLREALPFHTINEEALKWYFHLGYVPAPHTIWNGLHKLRPGEYLFYDGKKLQKESWWSPAHRPLHCFEGSEIEALERMQEILYDAVEKRLVADVPFGTFLSGGIDSSLVTSVASKIYGPGLKTFSIGMDSDAFDESGYAKSVASQLKTDHTEFTVTANDGLHWVEKLPEIYQEPYSDSSAIPSLMLAQLARNSVTMVLSGDGGDELFLGYGAYKWARRWNRPFGQMLRTAAPLLRLGNDRYKRIADLLQNPDLPDQLHAHIFSQEQYLFSIHETRSLLNTSDSWQSQTIELNPGLSLRPAEKQAWFDLQYYLPDDLLVKVDRATMYFALEARVPLLDYRFVKLALSLPESMKLQGNISKYLLKKLLYKHLPKALFDRPKKGFSIPLASWLQHELAPLVQQWVKDPHAYRHNLIRHHEALKLVKRFEAGETRLYNRIWTILQFNLWYQKYHA